mgnify:CR=1 FL=1
MEWTDKRDLIDDVYADDVNKLAHAIIEIENNKTTEISETSTNEQYPSAKAVYDELNSKQDKLDPQKYFVPMSEIAEPQTDDFSYFIDPSTESLTFAKKTNGETWDNIPVYKAISAGAANSATYAYKDLEGNEFPTIYLKKSEAESIYQPTTSVVTVDSDTASITINYNFVYNFQERTAITITLPATVNNDFIAGFTFVSGATPTSLTMPTEIKFSGVDCFDGSFTPTANKTYQVIISRVATKLWGDVDARDYEAPTEETA